MNLIILEGPDGSGKTTLAHELVKLGYRYLHHGPPKPGEDIFRRDVDAVLMNGSPVNPIVIDRLHLSERIYGTVCRGGTAITELHERLVERIINARGGQVVLCLPPWRTVLGNWLKNMANEYVETADKLAAVQAGYVDLLYSKRPYLWFDYTHNRATAYAELLRAGDNYTLPPGFVGMPGARFLFVGERSNTPGIDLPFMSAGNSSGYLHSCLDEAGFEEAELAFVNALPAFDYQLTGAFASVIALGQLANAVLTKAAIRHETLEHPQYWKRFHAGERNDYVERLRKLRREAP